MEEGLTVASVLVLGGAGALLPDVLRLVRSRTDPATPGYLRWPRYWLCLAALVGVGALAAWLGRATTAVQALALGFAAPEVLTRLLAASLPTAAAREVEPRRLRSWWAR
jgi:hypothetical protein